jgi:multiple sugar transport system substrate-binding protein
MVTLKGITWDHPRGYQGLEAATAAFMALRPDIRIQWERHSLHHFEFHPVPELAHRYDVMIIDHPAMGDAVQAECLLNLDEYAVELELAHLAQDVVGRSLDSYRYGGGLWALPVDAASQTAALRTDLLPPGTQIPRTWGDVRELAQQTKLAIAYKGVHGFLVLFALCANLGAPPYAEGEGDTLDLDAGLQSLELMRELLTWCSPEVLDWNAITLLDAMRQRDDLAYCPVVYSYAPYSHAAYRGGGAGRIRFVDMPGVVQPDPRGSVLGGTGYAIARRSHHVDAAIAFGDFLMHREVQMGMGLHQGQPARRSVWLDPVLNEATVDFYRGTLATLEAAYLRPRHARYLKFQWEGGQLVEGYLRFGGNARQLIEQLDEHYRRLVQAPSRL